MTASTHGFKDTTEIITFVASLAHDVVKAKEDGKVSMFEAVRLVLGNVSEAMAAFEGMDHVLEELEYARPEDMDAAYDAFLERMEWNKEPRTGARDVFNESVLTVRQLLKLLRLIQNTVHPVRAVVVPEADPIADPQ